MPVQRKPGWTLLAQMGVRLPTDRPAKRFLPRAEPPRQQSAEAELSALLSQLAPEAQAGPQPASQSMRLPDEDETGHIGMAQAYEAKARELIGDMFRYAGSPAKTADAYVRIATLLQKSAECYDEVRAQGAAEALFGLAAEHFSYAAANYKNAGRFKDYIRLLELSAQNYEKAVTESRSKAYYKAASIHDVLAAECLKLPATLKSKKRKNKEASLRHRMKAAECYAFSALELEDGLDEDWDKEDKALVRQESARLHKTSAEMYVRLVGMAGILGISEDEMRAKAAEGFEASGRNFAKAGYHLQALTNYHRSAAYYAEADECRKAARSYEFALMCQEKASASGVPGTDKAQLHRAAAEVYQRLNDNEKAQEHLRLASS